MHPTTHSDRPTRIWPPQEVRTVCEAYLALADEAPPGLVEGLYLHGSLGFGEWHAGRSDVDQGRDLDRPARAPVLHPQGT